MNPGADLKFASTIPSGTGWGDLWDATTVAALRDCPAGGLRWAALGWRAGLTDGFADGFRKGYRAAERDSADAWHRMYLHVRPVLDVGRHDESRAVREARTDTQCPARCDRCSRCIRAAAAAENMRRYGQPDYPGTDALAARAEGGSQRGPTNVAGGTDRSTDVPVQLRRRRTASYRCPVLVDGRRDPLDAPPRRSSVQVRAIGRNTVEFVGCDRAVYAAIRTLAASYQRAPHGGAWLVRQDVTADDVMALLESRGYRVEVTL